MIVLDANILVRAVLGRRVRSLLDAYAECGSSPRTLRSKTRDGTCRNYWRSEASLFESEARLRLRGRDEDDWPVLAAAMGLGCPIWTEDADFFGTGVAVWTTGSIEIFLQAQVKKIETEG